MGRDWSVSPLDNARKALFSCLLYTSIDNPAEYISSIKPHIRPNEFEVLKSINSYTIAVSYTHLDVYKRQPYEGKVTKISDMADGRVLSFEVKDGGYLVDAGEWAEEKAPIGLSLIHIFHLKYCIIPS